MIKTYISENEPRMLDELFSLIRIPSISALPAHKEDMLACEAAGGIPIFERFDPEA